MRRAAFIIGLLLVSMIPFSAGAQPGPREITAEEVNQFLAEYRTRLMRLEIEGFMDLFAKNAVENRVRPYSDIREVYRRRMAESMALLYHLKIDAVQVYDTNALAGGRYEIIQTLKKGGKKRISRGYINWDLVREDGSLKIREVIQTPQL